jgi:hypothetical protein
MEVVRFQRSLGAVPGQGSFSVRGSWGHQFDAMGTASLRKYLASYKAATTYLTFSGVRNQSGHIVGLTPQLLHGSQSDFWSEIIKAMEATTQTVQNNGNIKLALDWFRLSSPPGDVSSTDGALQVAVALFTELATNNSAAASGQFELDIQNAISVNPFGALDPKPVFNWSVAVALDGTTNSIILTIKTEYDHMNQNNALEVVAGIIAGIVTAGILGPVVGVAVGAAGGVAAGIAVGAALDQAYDNAANNKLLDFLAHDLSLQPWTTTIGPITFTATHPTNTQYVLAMKVQLDASIFNEIQSLDPVAVLALAGFLGLLSTAFAK